MPIITQQYLTVVYITCTGLRNRGGNAPPTVKLGGANAPPAPPVPPPMICVELVVDNGLYSLPYLPSHTQESSPMG